MAQNIELLGATYNDVPAVDLPKSGGGMARFVDVTEAMQLVTSPTSGDILTTDANGQAQDSGVTITELKALVVESTSFSSLPQTISDAAITSDHVVMNSVLSNPSAQTGDWTITTSSGSLTISGTISGSTTVTLYLLKKQ